TGTLVSATELAAATRWRRRGFWCPVCKKAVHLRVGRVREPHFAHNPGEARPDCENYHPGIGGGDGTYVSGRADPPYQPLYLVEEPNPRGSPRWHLELLVPAAPVSSGFVNVPDGEGGQVEIHCARLAR